MRGKSSIDLFASEHNHNRQVCCAWLPLSSALVVDIIGKRLAYVNSPVCLFSNVLKPIGQFNCRLILIVWMFPGRHWYTELKSVNKCQKITDKAKSTVSTKINLLPSKSRSVQTASFAALHKNIRNKGFSIETRSFSEHHCDRAPNNTLLVNSKNFIVVNGKKDPHAAIVAECADFVNSFVHLRLTISH